MGHFSNTLAVRKSTPAEWLRFGADVGTLVNGWSYRTDLVVNLGEQTSAPAPALFNPATAEIEINTKIAFGEGVLPASIGDITQRRTQLEHAKGSGAILHEALHARFTRWSLEDAHKALSPEVYNALHTLEEGRIEAFGVRSMPNNRVLLRACAMGIVMADLEGQLDKVSNVRGAGWLSALTLGRVDAGVLEPSDVEAVVPIVESFLGADVIEKLREVWIAFQAHDNHSNATELYALAEKWVEILAETSKEKGEINEPQGPIICGYPSGSSSPSPSSGGSPSPSPSSDGTPSPDGSSSPSSDGEDGEGDTLSEIAKAIQEAIEDASDTIKVGNQSEIDNEVEKQDWAEQAESAEAKSKDVAKSKGVANEVFGIPIKSSGPASGNGTNSRIVEVRPPNSDERIGAVSLSKSLDKAKYRERDVAVVNSVLPQGKLRTRAMVQGQALKSKGIHQPVEAWSRRVRRMTDEPSLTIGVMVDVSGSMGGAMNPMASNAWILSEAGRRVQARTAMVYYGNSVFPVLKAGQHLEEVRVYSANDGTEEAEVALKALDGALNLRYGTGARLLVIVSDGDYRYDIRPKVKETIKDFDKNGVAVLWITYDNGQMAKYFLEGTAGEVACVKVGQSASEIANIIGQSAVKAIGKVGKRNG